MILSILHIIFGFLFFYLAAGTLYLLILSIAGRFGKRKKFLANPDKKRIAVLIPCYREDAIIADTALQAAHHNYPRDAFRVIVIADKLQPETIDRLKALPVEVVPVDVNMKSRSLHAALINLNEADFEIGVILDADNIMAEGCLEKINDAFHKGYVAIQCHRTAKNRNTAVAQLDAISEEININLFRRGPAVLGLSAAPVGSGMAFQLGLLKALFSSEKILNNPGEDREIDIQLMQRGIRMEYIDDAYVLDEKVASAGVFEKQRVRWLEAQIGHVRRFFESDMKGASRNAYYFNKLFQNLLLPRVLCLFVFGLVFLLIGAQWLTHTGILFPAPLWWLACFFGYALMLLIAVPAAYYSADTLKALIHIPVLMFSMIRALLKVRKNRKEFLHTPKSYTSGPSA